MILFYCTCVYSIVDVYKLLCWICSILSVGIDQDLKRTQKWQRLLALIYWFWCTYYIHNVHVLIIFFCITNTIDSCRWHKWLALTCLFPQKNSFSLFLSYKYIVFYKYEATKVYSLFHISIDSQLSTHYTYVLQHMYYTLICACASTCIRNK